MRVLKDVPKEHWGYLNLGTEAKLWRIKHRQHFVAANPLLQPRKTQKIINSCHLRDNLLASYGGWLEYRYWLWQGSYLDEGEKYIHLGVDFSVPARTMVYATQKCRVVRVGDDHPQKGGWGPHVVARLESGEGYLIYAHLLKSGSLCGERQLLHPGDLIGLVGEPSHNGQWFSHLHAQFMLPEAGEYYLKHWDKLDGYCNKQHLKRAVKEFRDPLPWVA